MKPEEIAFLHSRQGDYRQVFRSPQGQRVLADLAKFCRMKTSTFHPAPGMQAHLEGRREVFLRISNYLNLEVGEIYKLKEEEHHHG